MVTGIDEARPGSKAADTMTAANRKCGMRAFMKIPLLLAILRKIPNSCVIVRNDFVQQFNYAKYRTQKKKLSFPAKRGQYSAWPGGLSGI